MKNQNVPVHQSHKKGLNDPWQNDNNGNDLTDKFKSFHIKLVWCAGVYHWSLALVKAQALTRVGHPNLMPDLENAIA
jgi:hypothetical protein